MKIITIKMDLIIDDDDITNGDYYDKENIVNYLNDKLYNDPEFFGDFGEENIVSICNDPSI